MGNYCIRLFLESDEAEATEAAEELLERWSTMGTCKILYIRRYWKIQSHMEVVFEVNDCDYTLLEVGSELGVAWTMISDIDLIWNFEEGAVGNSLLAALRWANVYDLDA